ncbi:hypothetical protein D3C75_1080150 [compost metagenome]
MTNRTQRAPFVLRAMRLGAIFDHLEVVLLGQGHDRIHVTRPTCQMDTDNRSGARCQYRGNGLRGDIL